MKKYEGKKSNVIGNLIKKYREEKGIQCNTSEKYKNMYDKYTKKQKKKRTFFEWLKDIFS